MALHTRQLRLNKRNAAASVVKRTVESIFRNRRPLGVFIAGVATAAGYLATGAARPELALLFNTYCSMNAAGTSMEASERFRKHGHRSSAQAMSYTWNMDLGNMALSFVPFISWLHNSPDYVENGFAYMGVLAVTSIAAQKMEKGAGVVLLEEKFRSPFHHLNQGECVKYLSCMEKRENSWWRKPYWIFNPGKLEEIREEKEKVRAYMESRVQSKSL